MSDCSASIYHAQHNVQQFIKNYGSYVLPSKGEKIYQALILAQPCIEESSRFFSDSNGDSFKDKKVTIISFDSRFFLDQLRSVVKACPEDLFCSTSSLDPGSQAIIREGDLVLHKFLVCFAQILQDKKIKCQELENLLKKIKLPISDTRKRRKTCKQILYDRVSGIVFATVNRIRDVGRSLKQVTARHQQVSVAASIFVTLNTILRQTGNSSSTPESNESPTFYLALTAFTLGSIALVIVNQHDSYTSRKTKESEEEVDQKTLLSLKESVSGTLIKIHHSDMLIKFMQHKGADTPTSSRIDARGLCVGGVYYDLKVLTIQRDFNQFELIRALGSLVQRDQELNERLNKHSAYLISSCLFWQLPFPAGQLLMNIVFKPLIESPVMGANKQKFLEAISLIIRMLPYYASPDLVKMMISLLSLYQSTSRHGYVADEYKAAMFAIQHLSDIDLTIANTKLLQVCEGNQKNRKLSVQNIIMGMTGFSFSYSPHIERIIQFILREQVRRNFLTHSTH